MSVTINTTIGDLRVTLFTEERPRCCLNFLKLCKMKYYNFCLFHTIKRNFVAQTGDPTATGTGGESIFTNLYGSDGKYFEAEQSPKIKHTCQGLLSMINNGNNYHGSQFMVTLASALDSLDGKHSVFGSVIEEDFPTLSLLNDTMTGDDGIPYRDVRILHTWVTEDPFEDLPGIIYPPQSPEQNEACLVETGRIRYDEDIDPTSGMTVEEVERKTEDHTGVINAEILTMIGDLPSSDVKPPENILFVCKLNPLTSDEDLEVVFSRFGKILSCEVIRDWKTKDSLQYAFIEFENVSSCEEAYFKMDNVLIDDRRIHVDFTQSVSKLADAWMQSRAESAAPNPALDLKAREKELLALSEEFSLNTRHDRFKNDDFIFEKSDDSDESEQERGEIGNGKHREKMCKIENIKREVESPPPCKREYERGSHKRNSHGHGRDSKRDSRHRRESRDYHRDSHHKRAKRERESPKVKRELADVKKEYESILRGDSRDVKRESRHKHRSDGGESDRNSRRDRCDKHRDSSRNCKKMAKCVDCIKRREKYGR